MANVAEVNAIDFSPSLSIIQITSSNNSPSFRLYQWPCQLRLREPWCASPVWPPPSLRRSSPLSASQISDLGPGIQRREWDKERLGNGDTQWSTAVYCNTQQNELSISSSNFAYTAFHCVVTLNWASAFPVIVTILSPSILLSGCSAGAIWNTQHTHTQVMERNRKGVYSVHVTTESSFKKSAYSNK